MNPPEQIRVSKDKKILKVEFRGEKVMELSAEILRVNSPSAEVQGHSPDQRKIVGGKRNVEVSQIHPVGNYAVRIEFNDGHDTGIFTWKFLYEIGSKIDEFFDQYIAELKEHNLSRDN